MKILYAIQGTGNGHISRAKAILPHLQEYGEVDLLISGKQNDIDLGHPVRYNLHGAGFIFGKKGGVDLIQSVRNAKIPRFIKDIWTLPVSQYDLIFSDFEPISAWASKLRGATCIGLSHQAAFKSSKCPRPKRKNKLAEWLLKHYAPTDHHIGFHFQSYDEHIFGPIIQPGLRKATPKNGDHILVYLPSYDPIFLAHYFSQFEVQTWKVYAKHIPDYVSKFENIELIPCGTPSWEEDLISCKGAIVGAGFETPSELLFLGKKLMVVPMRNQYEQQCNAQALQEMRVPVLSTIGTEEKNTINHWLHQPSRKPLLYPDNTASIISNLISEHNSLEQDLKWAYHLGM